VVDLMDALRKSIGAAEPTTAKATKKPRKAASGQKEMLMPIAGKKPAKEAGAKKPAPKAQRKTTVSPVSESDSSTFSISIRRRRASDGVTRSMWADPNRIPSFGPPLKTWFAARSR
jgi:hypothetical protein